MLMPRQRRLHFVNESARRRRGLLAAMSKLPVRARVYTSTKKEPLACRHALAALLSDSRATDIIRIVIERRETSQDTQERRQIAAAVRAGNAPAALSYQHLPGYNEPLLWVADAVAWSYGAQGRWRSRISGILEFVRDVDQR